MVHLAVRMYCNRPTDHAINHNSIGLNRLTIQLLFNEVSLFTFSKRTHGFDVTVPKNYLKFEIILMGDTGHGYVGVGVRSRNDMLIIF